MQNQQIRIDFTDVNKDLVTPHEHLQTGHGGYFSPRNGISSTRFMRISPIHIGNFTKPIGSMYAIYMVTFTINIPQMLAYIPYMDPMGRLGCLILKGTNMWEIHFSAAR